jgi:hypothetical protein
MRGVIGGLCHALQLQRRLSDHLSTASNKE